MPLPDIPDIIRQLRPFPLFLFSVLSSRRIFSLSLLRLMISIGGLNGRRQNEETSFSCSYSTLCSCFLQLHPPHTVNQIVAASTFVASFLQLVMLRGQEFQKQPELSEQCVQTLPAACRRPCAFFTVSLRTSLRSLTGNLTDKLKREPILLD